MFALLLANVFYTPSGGRTLLQAMPLLLGVLCVLAIAYRYYSAFLAAKVAVLDDSRLTPAHHFNDGQNYHPTNKWVLFGHHFAAISGAGPLIGPVLAIQYGYMPGLLWLVIGVCLAGAVQDMLVLAAIGAARRQIAGRDRRAPSWARGPTSSSPRRSCSSSSSPWPAWVSSSSRRWAARRRPLPAGMRITLPESAELHKDAEHSHAEPSRLQAARRLHHPLHSDRDTADAPGGLRRPGSCEQPPRFGCR